MRARWTLALGLALALSLAPTGNDSASAEDGKQSPNQIRQPRLTDPVWQKKLSEETRKKLQPKPAGKVQQQVELPESKCKPLPVEFRLTTRTIQKIVKGRSRGATRVRYEIGATHNHIDRVVVRGRLADGTPFASLNANLGRSQVWYDVVWNNSDHKQGARIEYHAYGNDGCRDEDWHIETVASLPGS